MLDYNLSRFVESHGKPMAEGYGTFEQGMALIALTNDGVLSVGPSTGAAGEVFYGIAIFDTQYGNVGNIPKVVRIVATGEAIVQALDNMIAGSSRITANGGALNATTPEATLTGNVLTVPAATAAGTIIEAIFSYTPTVYDVLAFGGGSATTMSALQVPGVDIGVMRRGLAFVSNFDTKGAWVIGQTPFLGPNGTFAATGTVKAEGVTVSALPVENRPFLGLEIHI